MKHISLIACILACLLFGGCATPVGKTSFPKAEANFTPKQTYAVPLDTLWNSSLSALEKNRIGTASIDKTSGVIQTEYLGGQSQSYALGLAGGSNTRYKFNLTIRKQDETNLKLVILAKLESSFQGEGGGAWNDVSRENTALIQNLEKWLYMEVEKELEGK